MLMRSTETHAVPLVFSILTTHLNQGYFLGETLSSALSQEGAFYIDYILVDAGSTDNTQQVLQRAQEEIRQSCKVVEHRGLAFYLPCRDRLAQGDIKVRCQGASLRHLTVEGIGRTAGLNRALRLACGDIITCLDGDDIFADSSTLSRVASYFTGHPEAEFLYGNRKRIDYNGATLIEREDIEGYTAKDLKDVCFITPQAAFWRRRVFQVVREFDESYNYIHAWDFYLRCAEHYALHRIDDVLGVKRIYPESGSANPLNRFARYKEIIHFLVKNDALTERAILFYVVNSHPVVIEQGERLRLCDQRLRSSLAGGSKLNQPIRFGLYGDSKYFEENGWSKPEEGYTWTEGDQAALRIPIGPTAAEELILRVRLFTLVKPGILDSRTVGIVINGVPAGEWRLTASDYQDQKVRIPRKMFEGTSCLSIVFITRDAVSPKSLGVGNDARRLGVALTALRIDEPKAEADASSPPTLFHITHQKAGSQWILAVLRDLVPERIVEPRILNKQFFEEFISGGSLYPTLYLTRQEFELIEVPANSRKLIVIRDLRDTLVSYYFSLKHSHRILDEWGAEIRRRLNKLSLEDGLLHLIDAGYCEQIAMTQLSWLGAQGLFVNYEDLWQDETGCFNRIIRFFEIEADASSILQAVRKNTFEQRSGGRRRGVENVSQHLRKGTPGDWSNIFTPKVKTAFKKKYGQVLIRAGYEQSLEW